MTAAKRFSLISRFNTKPGEKNTRCVCVSINVFKSNEFRAVFTLSVHIYYANCFSGDFWALNNGENRVNWNLRTPDQKMKDRKLFDSFGWIFYIHLWKQKMYENTFFRVIIVSMLPSKDFREVLEKRKAFAFVSMVLARFGVHVISWKQPNCF